MNNLLSYCGLVDARIRASNKDLPVRASFLDNLGCMAWMLLQKGVEKLMKNCMRKKPQNDKVNSK